MAFSETKILEIVAEYIEKNPESNLKDKINEVLNYMNLWNSLLQQIL